MKPLYIRKETPHGTRKVMLDMAWISTHKQIRLPKYYFEDDIFLPYLPDKNNSERIEKYFLSKEQVKKEDINFFYFDFPFKAEQVEGIAI